MLPAFYVRYGIRKLSSIASIQTCQSYLNYCRQNNININSTLFRGTLYELLTKELLTSSLRCHSLTRVGGSFDEGIDILGNWDLSHFWNQLTTKPSTITSTKLQFGTVQPLLKNSVEHCDWHKLDKPVPPKKGGLSLAEDINVLVQCKNYDTKIKPATIREISGLYHHRVNSKQETTRTFMFIVSPRPLTYQALRIVDSLPIPMIHCKLSILKFDKGDIYLVSNWNGGDLEAVYMNAMARALLKGLNLELQFENLKSI